MFGEQSIYGKKIVTLDDKNRIILPKFTYAEKEDSLLVLDKDEYLSIYSEFLIDQQIKSLEDAYVSSDFLKRKQIDQQLLKIYKSILKKVQCDTQCRINLGKIQILEKKFCCIGAKDHIILDTKTNKR